MVRAWRCVCVVCVLAWCGCGEEELGPSIVHDSPNTWQVTSPLLFGSAVYVGGGKLLTNWHVAINSAILDVSDSGPLRQGESLEHFNLADGVDRARLDGAYCDRGLGWELVVDESDFGIGCVAVNNTPHHSYRVSFRDPAGVHFPARLLYANIELDLAIIEVDQDAGGKPSLDTLDTIGIALFPPEPGQQVKVSGHPEGVRVAVEEFCEVVSSQVSPLADPSVSFPSDLVVESFEADCFTVTGGSSGGPAQDPETGLLMGLVWTIEPNNGDTYISASSAWKAYLDNPQRTTNDSQLEALLEEFGVE